MRLTGKSQVTVPKRARDALGIGPGSEVDFQVDKAGVHLVKRECGPQHETRGQRMVRVLRQAGQTLKRNEFSADEIMEMTRGPFDDVNAR